MLRPHPRVDGHSRCGARVSSRILLVPSITTKRPSQDSCLGGSHFSLVLPLPCVPFGSLPKLEGESNHNEKMICTCHQSWSAFWTDSNRSRVHSSCHRYIITFSYKAIARKTGIMIWGFTRNTGLLPSQQKAREQKCVRSR